MAIIDNPVAVAGGTMDEMSVLQWMLNNKTNYAGVAAGLSTLTELPAFTQTQDDHFEYAFSGCSSLTDVSSMTFPNTKQVFMTGAFYSCRSLREITFTGDGVNGSFRGGAAYLCHSCGNLERINGYMPSYDGADCSYAFYQCSKLETVPYSLSKYLYLPYVTSAEYMFYGCKMFTGVNLGSNSNVFAQYSGGFSAQAMFGACSSLTTVTGSTNAFKNALTIERLFDGCTALVTLPAMNFSGIGTSTYAMRNAFRGCTSLSNASLNNVLGALATATRYAGTKTLKYIGLSSTQATTCTGLSNWSALSAAGWTTGY